jgi:uncharacterized protein
VTPPAPAEPFRWNVVGLLGESVGAERADRFEDATIDLGEDLRLAEPVGGDVRLVRTNRGILASANLHTALDLACSRCLRVIAVPVAVRLHEEYLPSVDMATGRALPLSDEPDVLRLTDHHELDLETPVREAIQLAEPIAALCRTDCPGLCVVCGARLGDDPHDHPDDEIDPRLEALRGFQVDPG